MRSASRFWRKICSASRALTLLCGLLSAPPGKPNQEMPCCRRPPGPGGHVSFLCEMRISEKHKIRPEHTAPRAWRHQAPRAQKGHAILLPGHLVVAPAMLQTLSLPNKTTDCSTVCYTRPGRAPGGFSAPTSPGALWTAHEPTAVQRTLTLGVLPDILSMEASGSAHEAQHAAGLIRAAERMPSPPSRRVNPVLAVPASFVLSSRAPNHLGWRHDSQQIMAPAAGALHQQLPSALKFWYPRQDPPQFVLFLQSCTSLGCTSGGHSPT